MFAVPNDAQDLQVLLKWAKETASPVLMLGVGTNLLVADRGIRGLVVQLGPGFKGMHIRGTRAVAGAAVRLSALVRRTLGSGLAGLEGLTGIPGTVGGAVCMNAGTPAGCISDSLESITAIKDGGELCELPAEALGLRYRHSDVQDMGLIILGAVFDLRAEDPEGINKIVESLISKRKRTQPVGMGTAGSMFKNPEGEYAGQLLEAVGAKGMQMGGARVSSKHANFIENTGHATAADVRELMMLLQQKVREEFGVVLEPEVELVGEW